jgi:hypothetical protein
MGDLAMLAAAPLLFEYTPGGHESRTGAVVSVCCFWLPRAAILSVTVGGSVVASDITGNALWSIPIAASGGSTVAAIDISADMEQLAIADQRHLHVWQYPSQTRLSILDPCSFGVLSKPSPPLLVRYLPSGRSLISVHVARGAVLIWDATTLLLQRHCGVARPLKFHHEATSVAWYAKGMMLLIFGPEDLVEAHVTVAETALDEEQQLSKLMRSSHQVTLMKAAERWQWWSGGGGDDNLDDANSVAPSSGDTSPLGGVRKRTGPRKTKAPSYIEEAQEVSTREGQEEGLQGAAVGDKGKFLATPRRLSSQHRRVTMSMSFPSSEALR